MLVFVQSKERAKELFHELIYDGINVDVIHSDRTQCQVRLTQTTSKQLCRKYTVVEIIMIFFSFLERQRCEMFPNWKGIILSLFYSSLMSIFLRKNILYLQ